MLVLHHAVFSVTFITTQIYILRNKLMLLFLLLWSNFCFIFHSIADFLANILALICNHAVAVAVDPSDVEVLAAVGIPIVSQLC